jgi:dTDP-glucose 4,6-dehydratase/UDP-glucuronate decarboxylase
MNAISDSIVEEDIQNIINDIKEFSSIFADKHVLVVGGKGFLGTYFVKVLTNLNKILKKPSKIIVVDNLITSKDKKNTEDNNVKFIEKDVSEKFIISEELHFIIHTASIASPPIYRKFPLKTIDVNYHGTRNLLELAKEKKIQSMLFLSSSEIYGDPTVIPTPESYWGNVSSTGPRACYDESKRLAETICVLYNQQYGVPIKIARPFNVYGPYLNLDDGRIIPDFMKNAIKNSRIIIHSDGSPTRSFCYITDAMRAFFRMLILAPNGAICNVGNDEEISVKDVAEHIKKIISKPIEIKFEKSTDPNYIVDNPKRRCPDLSNIKKLVRYTPQVKFENGIERLYRWYTGNLK